MFVAMCSAQHQEAAFRSVLAHQTVLKACVNALIHDRNLAADTFSDATVEIVRAWEQRDPGKPFLPWACGVARRVALENLRRESRRRHLVDEVVLENIAEMMDDAGNEGELSRRKDALRQCLERLSKANRRLIEWRYFQRRDYQWMSESTGKTVGALYIVFSRLHRVLSHCIKRQLRAT